MGPKEKPNGGKQPSANSNGFHITGAGITGRAQSAIKISSSFSKSEPNTKRKSQSMGPVTRKASLVNRKSADLDMPNKVLLRSMSASKTQQRRLSMSRSSHVSTDSDQSSDKNDPIEKSKSTGNVIKKEPVKKKKLPFSFSSDYQEDQIPTSIGDVEGFQAKRNPPKRQQSLPVGPQLESRVGNHVQFADLKPLSIEMDIAEQPEVCLDEKNYASADEDSSSKLIHGKERPNSIFTKWKRDFENEVKNMLPSPAVKQISDSSPVKSVQSNPDNQQSLAKSKPVTRDELMIAKTDDLIMEVAKFIKQIKSSRAENFPVEDTNSGSNQDRPEKDQSCDDSRFFNSSICESVDGLSSINCPSVVLNQSYNESAQSTFREKSELDDAIFSRPASAVLRRKSMSNDDIHGRISLTLRMIEQEEKRDMKKKEPMNQEDLVIPSSRSGGFMPSVSNPSSRPTSRSSCISAIPPQSSTPRMSYPDSSHRVPRMDNFILNSVPVNSVTVPQSARSCSCYSDHFPLNSRISETFNLESKDPDLKISQQKQNQEHEQSFHSQDKQNYQQEQSYHQQKQYQELDQRPRELERPKSDVDIWETSHENTKKIFSFLDEVEKSDRETLFGLKYDPPPPIANDKSDERNFNGGFSSTSRTNISKPDLSGLKTMDSLIRKGPVELAREQIILDRKLEESQYRIRVLEETLIQQRELNMRNLRNSEKDLKKRLNLQKEEFDLAFSRNEALINEMAAEKRILLERCDKLMKSFDENVEKYKEQIKSLQQKHLDEIKRLRKAQLNAENVRKQQWVGNKTQEIKEMTVKGLEPEVQRIIQRHQQEMNEIRAWHSDEIRETEERYLRKMNMQLQDMREKFAQELEEMITREKESANKRLESELKQREDEFETQKRRLTNDLYEEKERVACEEIKWKDLMQENVRKVQIKGEIQLENLKQEYETKISNLERRHESELKSLKDIYEVEKESWVSNYEKKFDQALKDRETKVTENLRVDMDKELREREKKLRDEFEKTRREDEKIAEARNKRIQEKLQAELSEMDQSEKDLKAKFTQAKTELISLEEQVFSLRTSLSLKDKQNNELQESNLKMLDERSNLTSVIRREFTSQIESLENEVHSMKATFVEMETKHKLEVEHHQLEIEKVCQEKDNEIDKIGVRVKQALSRKEETIQELQKQLDKANFNIQHLEGLIEQQRKDFLQSMTTSMVGGGGKRK